tara:strand:+ start:838 stop:1230 length:393 start_codon:yes stop_codon:yes gene_type:complete
VILHGGKPSSPSLARLAKLALVPVMSLGTSENSLALRASSLQGIATSKSKKLAKQFDKSTKIVYLYTMNKATKEFFASLRRNANAVQKLEEPKHLKPNSPEAKANRHLVQAMEWNASLEDLRKPISNIQL